MAGSGAAGGNGAVAEAVASIRRRIAGACSRAGRDPGEVTLLGACKGVEADVLREALDAGLSHLGENRVRDALAKMRALAERAPTWHLIGHLQRNKARLAASIFDRIESVDSLALGQLLEAESEAIGRELRIFVQVNLHGEASKHGAREDDLERLIDDLDALERVTVTGLMSIPPPRSDPDAARADFRRLRALFDRLRAGRPSIRHLSMGMSADFEVAIEEGATEVRVGTALFGARAPSRVQARPGARTEAPAGAR